MERLGWAFKRTGEWGARQRSRGEGRSQPELLTSLLGYKCALARRPVGLGLWSRSGFSPAQFDDSRDT